MTWILSSATRLLTKEAGKAAETLFSHPAAQLPAGIDVTNHLNDLKSSLPEALQGNAEKLIEALLEWVSTIENKVPEDVQDLFKTTGALAQKGETARKIGWPSLSLEKDFSQPVTGTISGSLDAKFELSGGFVFTLGAPADNDSKAIENLFRIEGAFGSEASASFKNASMGITAKAFGRVGEHLTWTLEDTADTHLTGLSVAKALQAAATPPDDLAAVHAALKGPTGLKEIALKREVKYGADAGAIVTIPVSIFGITSGIKASYLNDDTARLTISKTSAADIEVAVDIRNENTKSRGFSAGVKVNLSGLGEIRDQVFKKIDGVDDLLKEAADEADKLLAPAEKLLGPELEAMVKRKFQEDGLLKEGLLALITGETDTLEKTVSRTISEEIDNLIDLRSLADEAGKITEAVMDRLGVNAETLRSKVTDGLEALTAEALERLHGARTDLADRVASAASGAANAANSATTVKLTGLIDKTAASLVEKAGASRALRKALRKLNAPTPLDVDGVKKAIDGLRGVLKKVTKHLNLAIEDGIAISLAYQRVNKLAVTASGKATFASGNIGDQALQDAYKSLINRPLKTLDAWLPTIQNGALVQQATLSGLSLNNLTLMQQDLQSVTGTAALSLADFTVADKQTRVHNFIIVRSANGVAAGASSKVKETSQFMSKQRSIAWEGLFGASPPEKDETGKPISKNQILSLRMTHAEGSLTPEEMEELLRPYETADILEAGVLDRLIEEATAHQLSEGKFKNAVSLRLSMTREDFMAILTDLFPNPQTDEMGDINFTHKITLAYWKALKAAAVAGRADVDPQIDAYVNDMLTKLEMPKPQDTSAKESASAMMANSRIGTGGDLRDFVKGSGHADRYHRMHRAQARRLYDMPRSAREGLYHCYALHQLLDTSFDRKSVQRLQKKITKCFGRAFDVDSSKDSPSPWNVGFFDLFVELAAGRARKPAITVTYHTS